MKRKLVRMGNLENVNGACEAGLWTKGLILGNVYMFVYVMFIGF